MTTQEYQALFIAADRTKLLNIGKEVFALLEQARRQEDRDYTLQTIDRERDILNKDKDTVLKCSLRIYKKLEL